MTKDYCTPEGAKRLGLMIRQYWLDRGHDVDINLVKAGFVPTMRSVRVDIRSNMKNGTPGKMKNGRSEPLASTREDEFN